MMDIAQDGSADYDEKAAADAGTVIYTTVGFLAITVANIAVPDRAVGVSAFNNASAIRNEPRMNGSS